MFLLQKLLLFIVRNLINYDIWHTDKDISNTNTMIHPGIQYLLVLYFTLAENMVPVMEHLLLRFNLTP